MPTEPICRWCGADIVAIGNEWAHDDCRSRLTHKAEPIEENIIILCSESDLPINECDKCDYHSPLEAVEEKAFDNLGPFLCRWCSKPIFQDGYGQWFHRATVFKYCDRVATPIWPVEEKAAPSSEESEKIEVRRYTVDICIPCINLSGDECHTPGCIFFLESVSEVAKYLDRMLIRPVVDGEQMPPLQDGELPQPVPDEQTFERTWNKFVAANDTEEWKASDIAAWFWNAAKGQR